MSKSLRSFRINAALPGNLAKKRDHSQFKNFDGKFCLRYRLTSVRIMYKLLPIKSQGCGHSDARCYKGRHTVYAISHVSMISLHVWCFLVLDTSE